MPETEAIVLRTVDYGEADRIVTLLSPSLGKVRGMARSARRSRKRFGPGLAPGTHGVLTFRARSRSDLVEIEALSAGRPFDPDRVGLDGFAAGALALEIVDALTVEAEPAPIAYAELIGLVDPAAAPSPPSTATRGVDDRLARTLVAILVEAGYGPTLGQCVACAGETASAGDAVFDPARIGLVCGLCLRRSLPPVGAIPVSADRARAVARDELAGPIARDVASWLARSVEHVVGRAVRSLSFYAELAPSARPPA